MENARDDDSIRRAPTGEGRADESGPPAPNPFLPAPQPALDESATRYEALPPVRPAPAPQPAAQRRPSPPDERPYPVRASAEEGAPPFPYGPPSTAPLGPGAPPTASPGASTGGSVRSWATPMRARSVGVAAAITTGAVLAAGIVMAALVLAAAASATGSGASFPAPSMSGNQLVPAVGLFSALALGGHASGSGAVQVLLGSAAGTVEVVFFPLAFTALIAAATLLVAFLAERRDPFDRHRERLAAAAVQGALPAALAALVGGLAPLTLQGLASGSFGAHPGWTFALGSLLLTAAAFAGRALSAVEPRAPGFFAAVRAAAARLPRLAELATTAAVLLLVGLAGAIVVLVVAAVQGMPGAVWALAPVVVGNAVPLLIGVGLFGGVVAGAGVSPAASGKQVLALTTAPTGWAWALPVVLVLALLATGFAIGVARARRPLPVSRAWPLPVGMLVLGIAAWLLAGASATMTAGGAAGPFSGSVGGAAWLQPTWWTPACALAAGVLVEASARTLPAGVYALSPAAFRRLAGTRAAAAWVEAPGATPRIATPAQRRSALLGLAAAGCLAVVSGAGAVVLSVIGASHTPEAVVAEYLGHVESGDGAAAAALVPLPNETGFDAAGALAGATERIRVTRVETVDEGEESALVVADYLLAGRTSTQSFSVVKEAGFPFPTWRVTTPLAYGLFLADAQAGADVRLGGAAAPAAIRAYPGLYELGGDLGPYFETEYTHVLVNAPGASGPERMDPLAAAWAVPSSVTDEGFRLLELDLQGTDALDEALQTAVDAKIDECAASTDAEPEGCPFRLNVWTTVPSVTWSVSAYPTVVLSDSWASEPGEYAFRSSARGEAEARYTPTTGYDKGKERTSTAGIDAHGTFTIDGGTVTIALD